MLIFAVIAIVFVVVVLISGFTSPANIARRMACLLGAIGIMLAVSIPVTVVEVCMGVHKVDLGDVMPWSFVITLLVLARMGSSVRGLWTKREGVK